MLGVKPFYKTELPDWDSGFEFSGGGFTREDMGGFSDFFEELFGQRGRGGHAAYSSHFKPHPIYRVKGPNLHMQLPATCAYCAAPGV